MRQRGVLKNQMNRTGIARKIELKTFGIEKSICNYFLKECKFFDLFNSNVDEAILRIVSPDN
jgi:hypothetical protein